MFDVIRRAARWLAAPALLFMSWDAGTVRAQTTYAPVGVVRVPGYPTAQPLPAGTAASRFGTPFRDDLRRVQDDTPPIPSSVTPGDTPLTNTEDLSLPAAERAFGGGEPNTAVAEAEAKAEEKKPEDEQRWLQRALGFGDSPVKVYGWIQNGFTANANGNGKTRSNFGVNPNNQANKWMGNQYYLVFEKTLEQNDEVNFGFRVDNLFGNDWAFNYEQGFLNNRFRPVGTFAGYDLAQVYAEAHLPDPTELTKGIDIKGGRFYTLVGYEVVPAIGRPLYSVPYMFNYGQAFTHFGVMTTWHLTDRLSMMNGAVNGWDRWINDRYQWGYHGGFTWTSKDEKFNIAIMNITGPNQFPSFLPANQQIFPTGEPNIPSVAGLTNPGYHRNIRSLFTTVLTYKWNDKLTQVIETDQGWERSVPGLAAPIVDGVPISAAAKSAQWQSFGNWFLYNFTDKVTGVWRSEVFWDQQGARTSSGLNTSPTFIGERYYEITLGAIYKPVPYIWIRPEARYDWSQYHPEYTDNTRSSQFTYGLDVILLY